MEIIVLEFFETKFFEIFNFLFFVTTVIDVCDCLCFYFIMLIPNIDSGLIVKMYIFLPSPLRQNINISGKTNGHTSRVYTMLYRY